MAPTPSRRRARPGLAGLGPQRDRISPFWGLPDDPGRQYFCYLVPSTKFQRKQEARSVGVFTKVRWGGSRSKTRKHTSHRGYRGTSFIRNSALLGTYGRTPCLGPYGGPRGGGLFLMSEVPLYSKVTTRTCTLYVGFAVQFLRLNLQGYFACRKTHPPRTLP